jgi:hypothetical protein
MNIAGLILSACCAALCIPQVARADCQWNVSGDFTINQDNGYSPNFHLSQTGSQVSGTAYYTHGQGPINGTASGTIQRSRFYVTVTWDPATHTQGLYVGDIDSRGHMHGSTRDLLNPTHSASWSSPRVFSCLAPTSAPAPAPAPRPSPLNKQRVCVGIPVPQGFIIYQTEYDPAKCASTEFGQNNVNDIEEYDNQPVGTQLLVCQGTPPNGWTVISTTNNASSGCGPLMTIQRIR